MKKSMLLFLQLSILAFSLKFIFLQKEAIASNIDSYIEKELIADFTKFKIGDIVPDKYRSKEYIIKQWELRNLPAPDTGAHWTYMGEHYVLIRDSSGKISRIYNRDIFYHR